jgi:hypothetical protein
LHEDTVPEVDSSWFPRKSEEPIEKRHTFSTNVPNVSRILSQENIHAHHNGRPTHSLTLRFMPNPFFMPENPRAVSSFNTSTFHYFSS